ncbi:hypothetical protein V5799_013574 [Amblyomma americanum]|uniref:Uncharacterized protein n=1 Tax=Amblyomma americanum TaxID=6943 RepID=A0AAQ4E5N6_AMBAM
MQWANIASKMQDIAGRSFTVRAVRDRTELLLGHYAANDRASLNKSGTEEQYRAREVLLQEVLDLAREHGVKLRARCKAYPAPAATPREANCALTVQSSPAQTRDTHAAAHFDGSAGDDQSESTSQTFNQILNCNLNDSDTEDVAIQNLDDQTETVQLPGFSTSPAHKYTGQAEATAPAQCPAVRGKKRQEQSADYEFLEKRLRPEQAMKEKDFLLESRRLALEEQKLAWEKEKTLAELNLKQQELNLLADERAKARRLDAREKQHKQERKAEEHRTAAAQQQAVLSIVEKVLSKINKIE